jgi:hypothetical protein
MANSILTPSVIAAEMLMRFKNKLGFISGIDKQYSKQFAETGAKIGNTITVRKPPRFTIRTGAALQVQSVVEESQALVLSNQKGADFLFNTADLTLTIDDFMDRYVDGAIVALANQVDVDGLTMAAQNTANTVGTPGTTPGNQSSPTAQNTLAIYLAAQQKLNEMACPSDNNRSIFINPAAQAATVAQLSGLFQSSSEIAEQYEKGVMGMAVGATWYMAQNINSRTIGALGGTPVVSGAAQSGASLLTSGWSNSVAGLLNVGDVFTIAGVYSVNPITKQQTQSLQQFIATAVASSNGSGVSTVAIYPSIVTSGSTQTVSGSPANSASITVLGAAGTVTPQNILCHKNAFTLGCADMEMPEGVHFAARATDPESGLSIRIVRQYDINSDTIPCRLDILYGLAPMRPEWACRISG